MGTKYVEGRSIEFAKSYEESGIGTPIFFILSPGVDPLKVQLCYTVSIMSKTGIYQWQNESRTRISNKIPLFYNH